MLRLDAPDMHADLATSVDVRNNCCLVLWRPVFFIDKSWFRQNAGPSSGSCGRDIHAMSLMFGVYS